MAGCQTRLPELQTADQDNWQNESGLFNDTPWQPHELSSWEYAAKVGIVIDGKSEQANLAWRYHDQSNEVRLFGPLGSGAVKLQFDRFGVVLTDNKGRSYSGDTAEQLLSEIVGWPLPVNALRFWLFARPTPNAVYDYQLDESGQLLALRQLGWQIDFKDWRDYQGQQLPRKVFARRLDFANGEEEQQITVKLITKSWQWE